MAFKIISFDSDGVGVVGSALLLHRLDPKGDLIRSANMFAGNGMGAVTALALASGIDLEQLIVSFMKNIPGFFAKTEGNGDYCATAMTVSLSKLFGAARLCELPLSGPKVMVNVDRLFNADAHLWHTHAIGSGRHERFADMLLSDLAIAACSAQGFFGPHILRPVERPSRGIFRTAECIETNPAADAMAYAEEHFGVGHAEIQMISIGRSAHNRHFKAMVPASEADRETRTWAWPFSRFSRSLKARTGLVKVDSNSRVAALGDRYARLEYRCTEDLAFDEWAETKALFSEVESQCQTPEWQSLAAQLHDSWKSDDAFSRIAGNDRMHRKMR